MLGIPIWWPFFRYGRLKGVEVVTFRLEVARTMSFGLEANTSHGTRLEVAQSIDHGLNVDRTLNTRLEVTTARNYRLEH